MKIEIIKVGYLECNCYLLDIDGDVLVIDPGDESYKIINQIGERNVVGVIITHYHFDHIGALDDVVSKYRCNVYDRNNMNEGDNKIGNFLFEIIYTPGHKEDCITVYFKEDNVMFVGDFIFKDNIGRCDLDGGNFEEMMKSIIKIRNYNEDILIYSGHGDRTILGYEIKNNVYF